MDSDDSNRFGGMHHRPPDRAQVGAEEQEERCLRGTEAERYVIAHLRGRGIECDIGPEETDERGLTTNKDVVLPGGSVIDAKSSVMGVALVPLAQSKFARSYIAYVFVMVRGADFRLAGWMEPRDFWAQMEKVLEGDTIPGTKYPAQLNAAIMQESQLRPVGELINWLKG